MSQLFFYSHRTSNSCLHHSHLATIIVITLNQVLANARDAKRVEDAQSMMKALTEYYVYNGSYPYQNSSYFDQSSTNSNSNWNSETTALSGGAPSLITYLKPYLNSLPVDPINCGSGCAAYGGASYGYWYFGNQTWGNVCPISTGDSKALSCFDFYLETSNQQQAKSECPGSIRGSYGSGSRFQCTIAF